MELPLQITFRNVESSDFVKADIEAHAAKLDQYFDRIVSCRVAVEATTRRGHKGKLFTVRVELGVPGKEIVTNRTGFRSHTHEDVHMAVKSAFGAAARALEDHARKIRGDVKTPAGPTRSLRTKRTVPAAPAPRELMEEEAE